MTNELSKTSENIVPAVESPYQDSDLDAVLASTFLPRVQLFTSAHGVVKEGKFPMNHFGLVIVKDNIVDLGKEVIVLLLAWRPRAVDLSDLSNIRSSSNPNSPLFNEIKEKALTSKNSIGYLFGPEYLIWVPEHEAFATLIFGGKTTRNEARTFHQLLKKDEANRILPSPAMLKSKLIKTEQYTYQSLFGTYYSGQFNLPNPIKCVEVQQSFLYAPEQAGAEVVGNVETVER